MELGFLIFVACRFKLCFIILITYSDFRRLHDILFHDMIFPDNIGRIIGEYDVVK